MMRMLTASSGARVKVRFFMTGRTAFRVAGSMHITLLGSG